MWCMAGNSQIYTPTLMIENICGGLQECEFKPGEN